MDILRKIEVQTDLKFNEEQIKAIMHFSGPALTLAVPGSGKTTLLLARTINLIEKYKVKASSILTITFSKAASLDMNRRYEKVFYDSFPYKIKFSTIHSFCYQIFKAYCKKKNLKYTLIETNSYLSKQKILSKIYLDLNKSYITEDKLEELSNSISFIKNMLIDTENIEDEITTFSNLKNIFIEYENFKSKNMYIDFDDMLTLTFDILKNHPKALEYYRKKYDFIQVDETQDTSKIQHEIIKLIANNNKNVFMVADDDQSIYGFRGAYPEMLLNFSKEYKNASIYYLKTNYRSYSNIIDVCNDSIKSNTIRYKKEIKAHFEAKGNVEIINFDSTFDRNNFIINQLKKNTSEDYGILYRNNISGISVANELELKNISFNIRDSKLLLFKHWVTKDIKLILSLSLITQDLSTFEDVYYKINGYISKKMIQFVKLNHRNRNVFDVLLEYPDLKKHQITKLKSIRSHFQLLAKSKPADAIRIIEEELGYTEFLSTRSDVDDYSFLSLVNIIVILKEIASSCDSILSFFERLDTLEEFLNSNSKNYYANTKLSTIHSAKGLEYDNVFIIDAENELFPNGSAVSKFKKNIISPLEEERRLFYVGISRAKKTLRILNVKFKNGTYVKPSIFTNEISKNNNIVIKTIKTKKNNDNLKFNIGDVVIHNVFGEGVVKDSSSNIVKVEFNKSIKELSTNVVIEYGLMKLK
ncbi:ATP-dependent helicase [Helicovermis profundi]|uniref:DNA 3'-5' helicase n=1 Tax=Helicovermis profundi TaxID=3065157 RepID=A0AAU9E593_9FIRM|nr:ATP-dependent helicase [Clostridia bacterium S502]